MGHGTGRPAPAVTKNNTGDHPATGPVDPRWAELAAHTGGAGGDPDDSLACPSCGANLLGAGAFEIFRVCDTCHRHFPLPGLERLHLLVDADTFVETNGVLVSLDPLIFRDLLPFPDRLEHLPERPGPGGGLGEAVITGMAEIEGRKAALLLLDHTFLGGDIGPVAAEKVVLAMEMAANRRLPLIVLCAASYPGYPIGEDSRSQAGMLSLAQWPKIAAAAARLRQAAVPVISLLAHPTTGGVYAGLGGQADIILAEPGAHIGPGTGRANPGAGMLTAEDLLAAGQIDALVDRRQLRSTLATLLGLFADRGGYVVPAEGELPQVSEAPVWEQMVFARHPERPSGGDFAVRLLTELVELHGDRLQGDDPAMICGVGRLGHTPVAVIAQTRVRRDTGLTGGLPKAVRLMGLAGHFELPILILIDSGADSAAPASHPAPDAPGTGMAIAELLRLASSLPVPIISVITGQASGIEAMALSAGDRRLMLQHALLSADEAGTPEWWHSRDPLAPPSNLMLRPQPLTAREGHRLGLIDTVVPEPEPAAHADLDAAARLLHITLVHALAELTGVAPRRLLEDRSQRVRSLGEASPEGREAARRELRELQELQRTLSRSLGDLRGRWEGRPRTLPRLPRPTLPSVPTLHRPVTLDPARLGTRVRPELADLAGRIAEGVRARGLGGRDSAGDDDDQRPPLR